MTTPDRSPGVGRRPPRSTRDVRLLVLGGAILAASGVGWFLMSWRIMHTPASDAGGEALGVVLGLLIVVSVVGAIRRRDPDRSDDGRAVDGDRS
ncbi:MAG: hypothetical protein IRY92_09240 [Dactylosporangium sp.]|nr:hypothetical protein [Dactylosporangium sp.]